MRNMVLKGSAEMKHVLASLTIGACLLLPSAGVVLGANPHTVTGTTGQPGTNNGITCNSTTTGGVVIGGGPGGSTSGDGSRGVGNPAHAVAQYDVACFQAP